MTCVVYRMYGESGVLLYVGITERGVSRIRDHERDKHWWGEVETITLTHVETREQAKMAEIHAILTEAPSYNVQHVRRDPHVRPKRTKGRPVQMLMSYAELRGIVLGDHAR